VPGEAVTVHGSRRAVAVVLGVSLVLAVIGTGAMAALAGTLSKPAPVPAVPLSVSCPAPGTCMAVDDHGNALTFRDGSWSRPRSVEHEAMSNVSCSSPRACVAVDVTGRAFLFDGTAWAASTSVTRTLGIAGSATSDLLSCSTTDTFCLVVDVRGYARSFDGTNWSRRQPMKAPGEGPLDIFNSGSTTSVSCPTSAFCGTVTALGRARVLRGSTWEPSQVLVSPSQIRQAARRGVAVLTGISCPVTGFCVAVDTAGHAFELSGDRWGRPRLVDGPSATSGDRRGLTAVSCAGTRFCAATDGLGQVVVSDGASWGAPQRVDPTLGLTSISCPSADFCAALDDIGDAVTFDGSSWTAPRAIEPRPRSAGR